ncbi:MAG: YqgE/AlgH family protein [Rickettsiales bacterium]|nr:MAG: YqgE/AlgH family protein [Rickettsiales bacterium]
MKDQNFSNLTGKILIASPFAMAGNVFHKSLIYVIKHTEEGSIGLIINRLINNTPAKNVFGKIKGIDIQNLNLDIYIGGPVEVERGFFLHTSDYNKNLLFHPDEGELAVSSNVEILKDIVNEKGPKNSIFTIGYTGWSKGELELELENNLWIITYSNLDLIFSKDNANKWSNSLSLLGISSNYFVPSNAIC